MVHEEDGAVKLRRAETWARVNGTARAWPLKLEDIETREHFRKAVEIAAGLMIPDESCALQNVDLAKLARLAVEPGAIVKIMISVNIWARKVANASATEVLQCAWQEVGRANR